MQVRVTVHVLNMPAYMENVDTDRTEVVSVPSPFCKRGIVMFKDIVFKYVICAFLP